MNAADSLAAIGNMKKTALAASASASPYLNKLLAGQSQQILGSSSWLNTVRAAALERVGALTIPTVRDEEWRFTDISLLTKMSFQSLSVSVNLLAADIQHWHIAEASTRLVFVDGIFSPHLSHIEIANGIKISNLAAGEEKEAAAFLGRHAEFDNNVFTALNTAFLNDGALIVVPRGVAAKAAIHLLFIATQKDVISYPRCLLIAESGSTVTVIEDYVALQDEAYFTNAVTEIVLANNARVNHIRVQREGAQGFHIAHCTVSAARASNYQSVSVALGARISRYNLNVALAEGAECAVDGTAIISERQLADTHTCIDHTQPHGVSRQLHKCIVGDSAQAVFNGKIKVRAGAQRTDSQQASHTLLLSGRAQINTKPQLEIFADDVKCTHGATVGQLDPEEVFYLRSRGLSDVDARKLLTYAFGAEIIDRIPIASLKQRLEQTVLQQTASQQ